MPSKGEAKQRQNKRRNSMRDAARAVDRAKAILRYVHQRMGFHTDAAGLVMVPAGQIMVPASWPEGVGAGSCMHSCSTTALHLPHVMPLPVVAVGTGQLHLPQQAAALSIQPAATMTHSHHGPAGAGPSSSTFHDTFHETQLSSEAARSGLHDGDVRGKARSGTLHVAEDIDEADSLLDASLWEGLEQDAQLTRLFANCEEAANELDVRSRGLRDRDPASGE